MISEILIDEVQRGFGSDPRLDADTLRALGFTSKGDGHWHFEGMTIWNSSRSVTKSLDLVIALVEWRLPDLEWHSSGQKTPRARYTALIRSGSELGRNVEGTATSPARALLGAFLRAVRAERHGE